MLHFLIRDVAVVVVIKEERDELGGQGLFS